MESDGPHDAYETRTRTPSICLSSFLLFSHFPFSFSSFFTSFSLFLSLALSKEISPTRSWPHHVRKRTTYTGDDYSASSSILLYGSTTVSLSFLLS